MALIELERLTVDVVEATPEELFDALDEECREHLGMTASEFIKLIQEGRTPDEPAAIRLGLLAEALIERLRLFTLNSSSSVKEPLHGAVQQLPDLP